MANFKQCMNGSLCLAAVLLASGVGPAFAEGGSGFSANLPAGPVPAAGSPPQGNRYTYEGGAEAGAYAQSGPGGNSATVSVGSYGAGSGRSVTVSNSETATSFVKGTNVIAKGRSETVTKIDIGGNRYVVADELAIAVARASQFGATAAANLESGVAVAGGSSGGTVPSGKPSGR